MKLIERIPAHYEVEQVEDLGHAYRWCPEKILVQCDTCAKRMTFKRSRLITPVATCDECGASSNTAEIREQLLLEALDKEDDEVMHPWRYRSSKAGIPV